MIWAALQQGISCEVCAYIVVCQKSEALALEIYLKRRKSHRHVLKRLEAIANGQPHKMPFHLEKVVFNPGIKLPPPTT